ncbi:MAG: hypothetical protein K2J41_05550 [Eubacterium sp.]|nr:hypothetical protein [Eubacterium sp.]
MKKFISLLSVMLMIAVLCPNTAFAEEKVVTDRTIEYFEDGSYIVTELTESTITTFATKTVSKSKSADYYESDNTKAWTITLSATFSYTGSSATCTNATTSSKIYNDKWKVTSAVPSKSGNKATGAFTVKKYVLGVPIKTVNKTLTITCSNTGVCS